MIGTIISSLWFVTGLVAGLGIACFYFVLLYIKRLNTPEERTLFTDTKIIHIDNKKILRYTITITQGDITDTDILAIAEKFIHDHKQIKDQ